MPVYFNGKRLTSPAVVSQIDDSAMLPRSLATGNVLAIIGRSEGGQPKKALRMRSPSHARQILRTGEGLRAVEMAFAPSVETRGPAEILFFRVNPATRSSLVLKDGATNDVITLNSTDYGLYTQTISIEIEAGSDTGKRVTTRLGNRTHSQDNIARAALTVQYLGAEATATVSVTDTALTLVAGANTVAVNLEVFPSVQQLVDRINAETGWVASVVAGSANTPALRGLDHVSEVAAKASAVTLRADLQAIIDWINGFGEPFVTATREANAGAVPANLANTFLAGGVDGDVTNEDWADVFDELMGEDVQYLVPLTAEPAVWAMADAHCLYMSTMGQMERRAFVGAGTGVDMESAAAAATQINSDRLAYVAPGIYNPDEDGNMVLYPAYMHAAMIAGGFSGLNPGETLTNKSLRIMGLEYDLHATVDTDFLIDGGVLATMRTPRGFRVVRAISTWQNDRKFNRVEISCGIATDFTARSVRDALRPFVGAKANPQSRSLAISRTQSVLRELARPEPEGPGVLAGDQEHPAYRNIRAEIEEDVLRVSFECSPVIPINYVLVTISVTPYSSTQL